MPLSRKSDCPVYSNCHRHVGKAVITRVCLNNNGAFVEGKVVETECPKSINKTVLVHFSKIYNHLWMYDAIDLMDLISIDFPLKQGSPDILAFTAHDTYQPDELMAKAPAAPATAAEPQPSPTQKPPGTRKPAEFSVKRTFRHEEALALGAAKELLCMQNHEVLEHCVRFAIKTGYVDHVRTLVEAE